MKRYLGAALIALLLGSTTAMADLYQWKDKEGVIHITDDLKKVPEGYRDQVKVFKSTPSETSRESQAAPPPPAPPYEPAPPGVEFYGEHPLEWWQDAFAKKKDEIRLMESSINSKREFVMVFEGGRRFGQSFGEAEIATYQRYKTELPEDEKRLLGLKDEIDDLRRKATLAGVPREVRE